MRIAHHVSRAREPRHTVRVMLALASAACLAVAAGCGGDDSGSSGGSTDGAAAAAVRVDQHARSLLPAATRRSGTLKVATELNWPPFTFKNSSGPTGADIDLITAIAHTLGLKPAFTDLKFPAMIPGIKNGRFDVAVSQLLITPEREAVVNFVPYISNPLGVMVRESDAGKIAPDALCGHTLVATEGTAPLSFGRAYSKNQCVAKGKPPIKFLVFDDSGTTILALANGRGDGFISDGAVGAYLAKTAHKGLTMDQGIVPGSRTRSGIPYSKSNPKLGAAIRAALLALMDNGVYHKILDKWGIAAEALTQADVRSQD